MKNIWRFALAIVCALTLTACSDDDDNKTNNDPVYASPGVYVLSEGNYYSKVNGELTYYNASQASATSGIFATANKRALTGTSNDGIVYGTRLYITNTDENIIEVVDAKTIKSIAQINLSGARCIIADGGYIYVTSFNDGTVAKIDTTSLKIVGTAQTDMNPEGMTILNGKLYVANSGYGYGNTVTKIDLATFKPEASLTVPTNPVELLTDGNQLYLLCSGEYKADYTGYEVNPAAYSLLEDGTTTKITDATIGAIGNGYLYLINNNFYNPNVTFEKYDLSSKSTSVLTLTNLPFAPYAINVNPANGDIYITTHKSIQYTPEVLSADFSSNCTTMRFNSEGSQLDQFEAGINAGTIIFF